MKFIVAFLTLVLSLSLQVHSPCLSQEASGNEEQTSNDKVQEIDEEKKKAISELLEITEIDSRIELLDSAFKSNASRTFRLTVIDELRARSDFKSKSKDDLKKIVVERTKVLSDRYNKLFSEQIKLDSIVKKIAFGIYAKYFSTDEIKDIIAFYKTPTGTKARKVMPKLSRESMLMTQKLLKPKLKSIVEEVLREEKKLTAEKEAS